MLTSLFGFSCQLQRSTETQNKYFVSGSLRCPDINWSLHDGSCLLGVTLAKTWSQADDYCKEQDGGLVKADSEEKVIALSSIHGGQVSWIGLRDDRYDLEFRWVDGSDFDYSNWDSQQPSDYSRKHCATMEKGQEKWTPYYCKDEHLRNPFCKKRASARSKHYY